jgi:uncharacterized protein
MPGGLMALLDDVSIIARAAAASIDDVGVAASKAGTKAAGVVIDDAAVTPGYVTGLTPARELPIIWEITKGSLKNKLLILLPGALALSWLLPQAIIFLLMLGGAYLCYEGAEKVLEKLGGQHHGKTLDDPIEDLAKFEKQRINGAIRTDLILSAEIVAISLNEIATISENFWVRAAALALVGIAITLVVYGTVALIVKMDDVGLRLAERESGFELTFGHLLLQAMPKLLTFLSVVGTIAMLWVGGGIILHGTHEIGWHMLYDIAHGLEVWAAGLSDAISGILGWIAYATFSAIFGLVLGAAIVGLLHKVLKIGHSAEAH